jgi:hypothetical protein
MTEQIPGSPEPDGGSPEPGGWGAASITLLINTLFVGAAELFVRTKSVLITLGITVATIVLAGLIVTLYRNQGRRRRRPGRRRH